MSSLILPGSSALLPFTPFTLPYPDSQSRVSLALLKLPLGNLTPNTKPEMPEVPTHTHKHTQSHTRKHRQTKTHVKRTHCTLNVGVTWLCSPSSLLHHWRKVSSVIGDLLRRSQSLFDEAKGVWDPLFSSFPAE